RPSRREPPRHAGEHRLHAARLALEPRGRLLADLAEHSALEIARRILERDRAERVEHDLEFFALRSRLRIGRETGSDRLAICGRRDPVSLLVRDSLDVFSRHRYAIPFLIRIPPSIRRAVNSRDFTVFSGTSSTSLISLYERSRKCRRTIATR